MFFLSVQILFPIYNFISVKIEHFAQMYRTCKWLFPNTLIQNTNDYISLLICLKLLIHSNKLIIIILNSITINGCFEVCM